MLIFVSVEIDVFKRSWLEPPMTLHPKKKIKNLPSEKLIRPLFKTASPIKATSMISNAMLSVMYTESNNKSFSHLND